MTTLPTSHTYGKIVGRWIRAVGDTTGDPDKLPEALPVEGTVTITPKTVSQVMIDTSGLENTMVAVLYGPTSFNLNEYGELVDVHGDPGLWLISDTYTLQANFTNASWPTFEFTVTENHTELSPLDLLAPVL